MKIKKEFIRFETSKPLLESKIQKFHQSVWIHTMQIGLVCFRHKKNNKLTILAIHVDDDIIVGDEANEIKISTKHHTQKRC